jgi:hypothetical protein
MHCRHKYRFEKLHAYSSVSFWLLTRFFSQLYKTDYKKQAECKFTKLSKYYVNIFKSSRRLHVILWKFWNFTNCRLCEDKKGHFSFTGIVKWQGRRGVSGTNRTVLTLHTIADVFQIHLKGSSHVLNCKKSVSAFRAKKGASVLRWLTLLGGA